MARGKRKSMGNVKNMSDVLFGVFESSEYSYVSL